MLNALYTVVIYPLTQIIEFVFVFSQKVFKETGWSVAAVSAAISVLCLPLYAVAERWQQAERDAQKRLKPKADKIRTVFAGDERYMILSAYYRQNRYHPAYALRGAFGLLIQVPFFIAAYSYLSHLEALKGTRFLFIRDMGAPDSLLHVGRFALNVLPVAMTLINVAAGAVYAKGFPAKEKAQLYGTALVFLALLYNSPSGLVLYWTLNNVFSLAKNAVQKTKRPLKTAYIALCICVAAIDVYALFVHRGLLLKRLFLAAACSAAYLLPLCIRAKNWAVRAVAQKTVLRHTALWQTKTYALSGIILFLLAGAVIPGALVASSPEEFSFIEQYRSPFPFIGTTLLQSAGIFIVWASCLYFLFSPKIRAALTAFLSLFAAAALVNTFVFPGNYGFLTTNLVFSNAAAFNEQAQLSVVNGVVLALTIAACVWLLLSKHRKAFYSVQIIALISLLLMGFTDARKIYRGYAELAERKGVGSAADNSLAPVYHFSKTGKNVLLIMLDRAISGYVPAIFAEKPELAASFQDFIWYPNCVSLGGYTLTGAPALFGGYEYSPEEMQRRSSELLVDKYNEALLALPRLFSENGFSVTVTDPSWANFRLEPDVRVFNGLPNVKAENLKGRYTARWLNAHPDTEVLSLSALLKNNLMHFAFFKMTPVLFRETLYDQGAWLVTAEFSSGNSAITISTLDNYALLDTLPDITAFDDRVGNTYTALVNDLTHEPAFFQAPEYALANRVTNRGTSPYADEDHYHANMAALTLLGKWFDAFRKQDVYDNMRIIVVADHGWYFPSDLPGNFALPGKRVLLNYNPLLLVKDFKDVGESSIPGPTEDRTFMSHADVPFLASRGITDGINPFTHKSFQYDKSHGITIATVNRWETPDPIKFTWKISGDEWLHVHDNIFDPANWERAQK